MNEEPKFARCLGVLAEDNGQFYWRYRCESCLRRTAMWPNQVQVQDLIKRPVSITAPCESYICNK